MPPAQPVPLPEIAGLVYRLRDAGFRTDTRQYLTAHTLLLAMGTHGVRLDQVGDAADVERLIAHLRPIFCRSPEEQARFAEVVRDWVKPVASTAVTPETTPPKGPPWFRRHARLLRWMGLAVVAAASLALYLTIPRAIAVVVSPKAVPQGVNAADATATFRGQPVALDTDATLHLSLRPLEMGELVVKLPEHVDLRKMISGRDPSPITVRPQPVPPKVDVPENQSTSVRAGDPTAVALPDPRQAAGGSDWRMAALIGGGVGVIAFGMLWLAAVRRRRTVLKRMPVDGRPDLRTFTTESPSAIALSGVALRRLVGALRRPRELETFDLDVERTVRATADAGGMFSPVLTRRKRMPEYLALIHRTSADDHLTRLTDGLVERLGQNGVAVDRYYFHHDPRVCHPAEQPARHAVLGDLAVLHQHATLFIYADAAVCFDGLTGELAPWVSVLRQWQRCALFTPEQPYNWTRQEWKLAAAGVIVLPATPEGLQTYAELTGEWRPDRQFPAPYARRFPPLLAGNPRTWLDRNAPPAATIEGLVRQLRSYLGRRGFAWLAACAVYPEISWPLTLNLAPTSDNSSTDGSDGAHAAEILPSLSRLPWLRYGYMPDWLRRTLIRQLTPAEDAAVRGQLEALLEAIGRRASRKAGGQESGIEIAASDVVATAPADSGMHDAVFIGFTSGASLDGLSVRAPRVLARLFPRLRRMAMAEDDKVPAAARPLWQRLLARLKVLSPPGGSILGRSVAAVGLAALAFAGVASIPARSAVVPKRPTLAALAFEEGGKVVTVAAVDGRVVRSMISGEGPASSAELSALGDATRFSSLAISAKGDLALGGEDGSVRVWNVAAARERGPAQSAHEASVSAIAFAFDGAGLGSAGDRKPTRDPTGRSEVIGWDVTDTGLREARRFEFRATGITSLAVSRQGTVAAGTADGRIRIAIITSNGEVASAAQDFATVTTPPRALAFSADGRLLASGDKDGVQLWDVGQRRQLMHLDAGGTVSALAFGQSTYIGYAGGLDRLAAVVDRKVVTWPIEQPGAAAAGEASPSPAPQTNAKDTKPNRTGPKIISFTASPTSVVAGGSVDLCFELEEPYTARVFIEPDVGETKPAAKACLSVSPKATTTYSLRAAYKGSGEDRRSVIVSVIPPPGKKAADAVRQTKPRMKN